MCRTSTATGKKDDGKPDVEYGYDPIKPEPTALGLWLDVRSLLRRRRNGLGRTGERLVRLDGTSMGRTYGERRTGLGCSGGVYSGEPDRKTTEGTAEKRMSVDGSDSERGRELEDGCMGGGNGGKSLATAELPCFGLEEARER